MNKEIMGALLKCAMSTYNVVYLMDIFQLYRKNEIFPNKEVLHQLDSFKEKLYFILKVSNLIQKINSHF